MNPSDVRSYLDSFINTEFIPLEKDRVSFKLDRVYKLLELLGNPQLDLKVIHVAGSKGKGSTCAVLANILKEAGFKVGLYTSPHLEDYRERIRICSPNEKTFGKDVFPGMITFNQLAQMIEIIKPAVDRINAEFSSLGRVSFFELFTVLAFLFFKHEKVDWVVLETGVGGRLDATNVCRSVMAIITPISLEHTALLGNTIADISIEKAAIIKADTMHVVIASQAPEAFNVFDVHCKKLAKQYTYVSDYTNSRISGVENNYMVVDVATRLRKYSQLKSRLIGEHQLLNLSTAITAVEILLGEKIDPRTIERAVANVFWPGRFEIISDKPTIVVDSAHNRASAEYLSESLKRFLPTGKKIVIIGASIDKDKEGICQALNSIADHIIFTKANHPKAYAFTKDDIAKWITGGHTVTLSVAEAMAKAIMMTSTHDVVVVAGSVFVASESRQWVQGNINRVIASEAKQSKDCFVAKNAPRNDGVKI